MEITESRVNLEQLEKQDVLDMIKFAKHIHVAGDGNGIDTCKKCDHDVRHIIHLRYQAMANLSGNSATTGFEVIAC